MKATRLVNRFVAYVALLVGGMIPMVASAHPGHDVMQADASHIVTSPFHIMTLALAGAAFWWAGTQVQRRVPARVLSGAGMLMLVGAVVLWGKSL
jgi:peptidoglycan/LPS O-acetylase OafA/YrhL